MYLYFMTPSGVVPTKESVQSFLRQIAERNGQGPHFYKCRYGPSTNNPTLLYRELSNYKLSDWNVVFITGENTETNVVHLFSNDQHKEDFMTFIGAAPETELTGQIALKMLLK